MRTPALVLASLLVLSAPLAWSLAPGVAAPADPSPARTIEPALAAPAPDAQDAAGGTLRVRLVNKGDATVVMVSVSDSSGVVREELRPLAARATTLLDYQVPLGKATSEVRSGIVGGASTGDLSRCPSRLVEHNYTLSASLTRWSISVDGWCAAGRA